MTRFSNKKACDKKVLPLSPSHTFTLSAMFVVVDCNLESDCWYPADIQVTNPRSSHMYLNISWCGRKRFVVNKNCGLSTLKVDINMEWLMMTFLFSFTPTSNVTPGFKFWVFQVCCYNTFTFYLKWCKPNRFDVIEKLCLTLVHFVCVLKDYFTLIRVLCSKNCEKSWITVCSAII